MQMVVLTSIVLRWNVYVVCHSTFFLAFSFSKTLVAFHLSITAWRNPYEGTNTTMPAGTMFVKLSRI